MTTSAMSFPAKLDPRARQAALVTYKLQGDKIKAALLTNPGKVIISDGLTANANSLVDYIVDHYPEGVILYCMDDVMGKLFKRALGKKIFEKSTIVWGNVYPNLAGVKQPIFANDICWFGGTRQKEIVRHPDFMGAVSSESHFMEPEVKKLCIQS
jgi:hypothetical protein